jgi:WD40 repeat protein
MLNAGSPRRLLGRGLIAFLLTVDATFFTAVAAEARPSVQSHLAITVQPNVSPPDWTNIWGSQISFAPNGKFLAASSNNQIKLGDIASGRPLRVLEQFAYVNHFAFTSDGSKILSVHKDGAIKVWDTLTGTLISSQTLFPFDGVDRFPSMRFDEVHNHVLLTTSSGVVAIWDFNRQVFLFKAKPKNIGRPVDARLSVDGKRMIVGGESGVAIISVSSSETLPKSNFTGRSIFCLSTLKRKLQIG